MPPQSQCADSYTISDDVARFDIAKAHRWMAQESYWAAGIPFARSVKAGITVFSETRTRELLLPR